MAIDPALLELLVCPESREPLQEADSALVERVNAAIRSGKAQNRAGKPVQEAIDGGLVRSDGQYLYAIRADIPNLLIDDAIAISAL